MRKVQRFRKKQGHHTNGIRVQNCPFHHDKSMVKIQHISGVCIGPPLLQGRLIPVHSVLCNTDLSWDLAPGLLSGFTWGASPAARQQLFGFVPRPVRRQLFSLITILKCEVTCSSLFKLYLSQASSMLPESFLHPELLSLPMALKSQVFSPVLVPPQCTPASLHYL